MAKAEEADTVRIRVLEGLRQSLFGVLQKCYDASKLEQPDQVSAFLASLETLENTREKFNKTIEDLNFERASIKVDYVPNFKSLEAFDELYCLVRVKERQIRERNPTPKQSVLLSHSTACHFPKVELPPLRIQTFNGDPNTWSIFYENFKSLIHNNENLSDAQKVQYLTGHLSHKALSICAGIAPTANNYQIIWDTLVEKYQDKRQLASTYLEQMVQFKPFTIASSNSLESFLEKFCSAVAAVKHLNISDLSDFIITHIALSKLDLETLKSFEQSSDTEIPTFASLHKFILAHVKLLSRTAKKQPAAVYSKPQVTPATSASKNKPHNSFFAEETQNDLCIACHNPRHQLYKCDAFMKLSVPDRYEFIKKNNCCTNCLGFHKVQKCKSRGSCFSCGKHHHTALHLDRPSKPGTTPASAGKDEIPTTTSSLQPRADGTTAYTNQLPPDVSLSSSETGKKGFVSVLPTAIVAVENNFGERMDIRVLLDSASTVNLITEKCCSRLGLKVSRVPSSVTGVGVATRPIKGETNMKFCSIFEARDVHSVQALVMDCITPKLPVAKLCTRDLEILNNLPMADKNFHVPGDIDCLLGADVFILLLNNNKMPIPGTSVYALETSLGYVVMGKCEVAELSNYDDLSSLCVFCEPTLEVTLQKFWELESVPTITHLSPEEKECEQMFVESHSRDESGRYKVLLPFKEDPQKELGNSLLVARRRFMNLEKRLDSQPKLREGYNATISDYIEKGYLSLVEESQVHSTNYFMPHSAVYREDKSTSKIRVVIDASSKSSSGKALNDILHSGANLQMNIFNLLIDLRLLPVALSADIEKMFFQINVTEDHRKFQCILFRFNSSDPLQVYQFNKVSFGTKSSPFLAMRVIRQLALDEGVKYPLAAKFVPSNLYMDDFIASVESTEKAKELYKELVAMLNAGGFNLTKWLTNSHELNNTIPQPHRVTKVIDFDADSHAKVVGLRWKPLEDIFFFESLSKATPAREVCTKRSILSAAAQYYDPLGLICPVVAYLKLLVQDCWKLTLEWDEPVPEQIQKRWLAFQMELDDLEIVKIPRHVGASRNSHLTLVGFADSSEKCYGATIYLRSSSDDNSFGQVRLLCAKSKLAPLANKSLPRLELCACLLLVRLIKAVHEVLNCRCIVHETYVFTDSTIALSWICSAPYRWQTFIANRTSAIQEILPAKHWRHVASVDNPSDIISRPITPRKLIDNDLWFHGPNWVSLPISQWPNSEFAIDKDAGLPEAKKLCALPTTHEHSSHLLYDIAIRVSTWSKLIRTVVYVLRFANQLKSRGCITTADLESAETIIMKQVQSAHFENEIKLLKGNKECSPRIRKLNPFILDGIIRVGGRLTNANIDYCQKHPIVLPQKDRIVELLIDEFHQKNLHAGPSLLLSLLRQKYWILSARSVVRQRTQKCNMCFRNRPRSVEPLMGQQPYHRVTEQIKPFWHSGVDYAGPLYVTPRKGRGIKSHKAYICLFICLATKAIHIELVSDLSTDMFIAAFKRFIARRGPVCEVHSDGGTNFLGAKGRLNEIYSIVSSKCFTDNLIRELAGTRTTFKTLPPYSPHMAGVWESQVKCVKTHLYRVIGSQILTYEELNTVLIQIEALLNSRPLCVLGSDPSEPSALTPAHFLHNVPLTYLPSEDHSATPIDKVTRRDLLDKLVQSYWNRWRVEYLNTLQSREKWNTSTRPIQLNSIVLIREDNVPPLRWPLGIVEEIHPGKDNITRVVTVKTATGRYKRPVVRICPLPSQ